MASTAPQGPGTGPRTLVEKIWDEHVVFEEPGAPSVIGIDLHLVHEVTSPQAFEGLRNRGLTVRHPERTVATADHSTPTTPIGACPSSTSRRPSRSLSWSATARSSASRSTRRARTTRASCMSSGPSWA